MGVVIIMTVPGKIIYGVGKVVGNTAEFGIELTGKVVSSLAKVSGKDKLAKNTKKYSAIASKVVGKTVKISAALTAVLADKTVDATINTAKAIAENAVKTRITVYGESEEFYDKDKYVEIKYKVVE